MTALRTLKIGLRGPDVVRWQRFLKVEPDGIFGPKTREVTIAFQRENGLEPDGVAGPKTFGVATARGLETIRRLRESEVDLHDGSPILRLRMPPSLQGRRGPER